MRTTHTKQLRAAPLAGALATTTVTGQQAAPVGESAHFERSDTGNFQNL